MNTDVPHQKLMTFLTELNEQEVLEEVRRLLEKGPECPFEEKCRSAARVEAGFT